jgi:hypothetical protein
LFFSRLYSSIIACVAATSAFFSSPSSSLDSFPRFSPDRREEEEEEGEEKEGEGREGGGEVTVTAGRGRGGTDTASETRERGREEGGERETEGLEGGGGVIDGEWRVEVRGEGGGDDEEGEEESEEGVLMSISHGGEGGRVTVDGRSIAGEGGTTSRVMGESVRMV